MLIQFSTFQIFTVKLVNYISCFSAGSVSETEYPKRRVSSKVVVIILLLCVALTTLAIIGSVMWYFYRKEKCSIEKSAFSSDKDSTYNSTTNLISHRAYSLPEFKVYIGSPVNPVVGKYV